MIDREENKQRVDAYRKQQRDEDFLQSFNAALASLEQSLPLDASNPQPLIFIVGTQRSGSTLLSQILARYLNVGYISNQVARFWEAPRVGIRLQRQIFANISRNEILLKSQHGVGNGLFDPHEFGYYWSKWFRLEEAATHALTEAESARVNWEGLRASLMGITSEFGLPVVFKNLICGYQIAQLSRIWPNSLFVQITRDPLDVVKSTLSVRMERYGTIKTWWSLKPPEYPQLRALESPVEQVVAQTYYTLGHLGRLTALPGVHSLKIGYAELCARPQNVLSLMINQVNQLGGSITAPKEWPDPLAVHQLPPHLLQAEINHYMKEYFGNEEISTDSPLL